MGTLYFHNDSKNSIFLFMGCMDHSHSNMEIYGLEGSMIIPDPNFFSGDILLSKKNKEWNKINNNKCY